MVQTTTCPLCEASCGVLVDTEGEHIRSIRGDENDPLSLAYVCLKALADLHSMNARLSKIALRTCASGLQGKGLEVNQDHPEPSGFRATMHSPTVQASGNLAAFKDEDEQAVVQFHRRLRLTLLGALFDPSGDLPRRFTSSR